MILKVQQYWIRVDKSPRVNTFFQNHFKGGDLSRVVDMYSVILWITLPRADSVIPLTWEWDREGKHYKLVIPLKVACHFHSVRPHLKGVIFSWSPVNTVLMQSNRACRGEQGGIYLSTRLFHSSPFFLSPAHYLPTSLSSPSFWYKQSEG